MMNKTIICILISFISHSVFAYEFKGKKGDLAITFPKDFKLYKDFLGLPFVLIKEESDRSKTSISITPTGIQKIDLDPKLLSKNYEQYKQGRDNWAKKKKFKILKFLDFSSFNNASNQKIVAAGYQYEKGDGTKNEERSFYVLCPKETFQIKVLSRLNNKPSNFRDLVDQSLKSSLCK